MHDNDALHETSADEIGGPDEVLGAENTQPSVGTATGLDEVPGTENTVPGAENTQPGTENTVDELEGQLAGLQQAMDQIQRGDLDGAEASIAASERSMARKDEEE